MLSRIQRHWLQFSIAILVVGALWIGWTSWAWSAASATETAPQKGFLAPDFTLSAATGETVRLADLRGRPVLLNLWASWCPPCRAEMPAIQNTYVNYQEHGLVVLAVNVTSQDSREAALEFASQNQLTFPILFDDEGRVNALYGTNALPTSYFIDAQGVIRDVVVGGPMAEALLRARVEAMLQGAP